MADRRRGESLAQGGVDGVPVVTFPAPGLDTMSSASGPASSASTLHARAAKPAAGSLEARIAELELSASAAPSAAAVKVVKAPPAALKLNGDVYAREGSGAQYSKSKIAEALRALDVDPDTICVEWLLTRAAQGQRESDCWRDCRSRTAHRDDTTFHRVVPGLKLAECRCDRDADKAGHKRPRGERAAKGGK